MRKREGRREGEKELRDVSVADTSALKSEAFVIVMGAVYTQMYATLFHGPVR